MKKIHPLTGRSIVSYKLTPRVSVRNKILFYRKTSRGSEFVTKSGGRFIHDEETGEWRTVCSSDLHPMATQFARYDENGPKWWGSLEFVLLYTEYVFLCDEMSTHSEIIINEEAGEVIWYPKNGDSPSKLTYEPGFLGDLKNEIQKTESRAREIETILGLPRYA